MEENLSFLVAQRADCKVLHMKLHEQVVLALERKAHLKRGGYSREPRALLSNIELMKDKVKGNLSYLM